MPIAPPRFSARLRRAYTLVEILIVVMILGILAVIVIPQFSAASIQARDVTATDQLRVVREQLVVYRAQHNGRAPGLTGTGTVGTAQMFNDQLTLHSDATGNTAVAKSNSHPFGPYLHSAPENPISRLKTVKIDATSATPAADGTTGWIYQPLTGRLFMNSTGNDSDGKPYFTY